MATEPDIMQMISRLLTTVKESKLKVKVILSFDADGNIEPEIDFTLKNESALKLFGAYRPKDYYKK